MWHFCAVSPEFSFSNKKQSSQNVGSLFTLWLILIMFFLYTMHCTEIQNNFKKELYNITSFSGFFHWSKKFTFVEISINLAIFLPTVTSCYWSQQHSVLVSLVLYSGQSCLTTVYKCNSRIWQFSICENRLALLYNKELHTFRCPKNKIAFSY